MRHLVPVAGNIGAGKFSSRTRWESPGLAHGLYHVCPTPLVIERFGEATAAVVSMDDFHLLEVARREPLTPPIQSGIDRIYRLDSHASSREAEDAAHEAPSRSISQAARPRGGPGEPS